MKKFNKIFVVFIFLLVTITHLYAYRIWLFNPDILTQGDWMLSLPEYSKELLTFPMLWKSYLTGSIDLTPPFYIFLLFEGILANLGIEYAYIQRIIFMWPIALLTLPLSYLFIRTFVKVPIAALIGALVYSYNTYFIIIQTGHLTLMVGFALAPLLVLLYIKTIETNKYLYPILTGLLAFTISYYEFRSLYLITLVCVFYYVYYVFFISQSSVFNTVKSTILIAILPLVIVLLLNMYWILPMVMASKVVGSTAFGRDLFGKEFFTIGRALTIFHPFWTGGAYFPFITQPIPPYFFLTPLFAFLGVYLCRRNKVIIFFACLAIIGIFLSKQNNSPFSDVYVWLYRYFPGFNAFREASKFYFFIALAYSVLIAAFFSWFWEYKSKRPKILFLKYFVFLAAVIMYLYNTKPLITNEIGTLFIPRTIPKEYNTLNAYLLKDKEYFRTLWLPVDSRWGIQTINHPKVSTANILTGTWKEYMIVDKRNLGDQFIDFYKSPISNRLLDRASIKYLIVPLHDYTNDDNFFIYFTRNHKEYVNELNKLTYLKKMNIGLNEVAIYKNNNFRPHLYTTEKKETIKEEVSYKTVPYNFINVTHYTISLQNISEPLYLNFAEGYHPDWNIRIGDFDLISILLKNNYFLSEKYHFKNDAGFNSFLIDPVLIKKNKNNWQYTENADGSISVDLTLYFKPQVYVYLGVIISIVSLSIILTYIFFTLLKKQYENKN